MSSVHVTVVLTSAACATGNNSWNASAGLPFGATFLGGVIISAVDRQTPSATGADTMLSGIFLLFMLSNILNSMSTASV